MCIKHITPAFIWLSMKYTRTGMFDGRNARKAPWLISVFAIFRFHHSLRRLMTRIAAFLVAFILILW
jgi:hypothetical protein